MGRTIMGKNVMRLLFKPDTPKLNELFLPGRMAYVMDLEEDGETDIPTTSIRSKQDIVNNDQKATLSTNDIVINKLTQILSYLRAGNRNKKKRKDKIDDLIVPEEDIVKSNTSVRNKDANVPIYDDVDDYKHKKESKDSRRERRDDRRDKERGRDRDSDRKREDNRDRDRWDRNEDRHRKNYDEENKRYNYFENQEEPREKTQRGFSAEDKLMIKALMKKEEEKEKQKDEKKLAGMMQSSNHDGYAECYPGLAEMDDAIGDSDDEADFSKMDQGKKKG